MPGTRKTDGKNKSGSKNGPDLCKKLTEEGQGNLAPFSDSGSTDGLPCVKELRGQGHVVFTFFIKCLPDLTEIIFMYGIKAYISINTTNVS